MPSSGSPDQCIQAQQPFHECLERINLDRRVQTRDTHRKCHAFLVIASKHFLGTFYRIRMITFWGLNERYAFSDIHALKSCVYIFAPALAFLIIQSSPLSTSCLQIQPFSSSSRCSLLPTVNPRRVKLVPSIGPPESCSLHPYSDPCRQDLPESIYVPPPWSCQLCNYVQLQ